MSLGERLTNIYMSITCTEPTTVYVLNGNMNCLSISQSLNFTRKIVVSYGLTILTSWGCVINSISKLINITKNKNYLTKKALKNDGHTKCTKLPKIMTI